MNSVTEAPGQGLMSRIRGATARCHQDLEDWIGIEYRFVTDAGYQDYLVQLLPLFCGYEDSLAQLAWQDVGLDFDSRRKVPFIEQDLHFFDLPLPAGEVVFPKPTSFAAGLGSLYVLEGSTLGGQTILERLKQRDIYAQSGAAFFNCYGEKTGAMWKAFKELATGYCSTEERMSEACAAAIATFDHYRQHIRPF